MGACITCFWGYPFIRGSPLYMYFSVYRGVPPTQPWYYGVPQHWRLSKRYVTRAFFLLHFFENCLEMDIVTLSKVKRGLSPFESLLSILLNKIYYSVLNLNLCHVWVIILFILDHQKNVYLAFSDVCVVRNESSTAWAWWGSTSKSSSSFWSTIQQLHNVKTQRIHSVVFFF